MKRIQLLIFLVVCFMVTCVTTSQAVGSESKYQQFFFDSIQVNSPYDFISLHNMKVFTSNIYIKENDKDILVNWTGNGFHVGIQTLSYQLLANNIPEDFVKPEDPYVSITNYDMYGNKCDSNFSSLLALFSRISKYSKFTDHYKTSSYYSFMYNRGGRYEIKVRLEPKMCLLVDTVDIKGEPGMDVHGAYVHTGKDMEVLAYVTTGWPYNPDTLSGNETVKWNIYKMKTDSTFTPVANGSKLINMKNADKPLLAGYDSVNVNLAKPEVGRYKIIFDSDFKPANRIVNVDVVDTLRATVKLDKTIFVAGTDKKVTAHILLDYQYPHISATKQYPQPTVVISSSLAGHSDSLLVSNDTLASRNLYQSVDWDISLGNVAEALAQSKSNTLPLKINITFNGSIQYSKSIILMFSDPTGINSVKTQNGNNGTGTVYDITGRRISTANPKSSALRKGMYIVGGKKVMIK